MTLLSSIFAFGSAGALGFAVAAFLPTNRRFGCFGVTAGSAVMPSSVDGPRFVAALSSSILRKNRDVGELNGVEMWWGKKVRGVRRT